MLLEGNPRTYDKRARLEMELFVEYGGVFLLGFYIRNINLYPFAGLRVMEGMVEI